MKIVAFINKNSGPGFHRIAMPLLLLPDTDVFITNNLLAEHFVDCDLFVYNRVLPSHANEEIQRLKKLHGFKICIDIDDYWELDEHHILFSQYQKENFAAQQIEHIKNADFITTTHSRLADEITPFNSNVHVLPNAIPFNGQFAIEREPSKLVRLFWQGSSTHEADINLLRTPVYALRFMAPKIKMVMAGVEDTIETEALWYKMVKDYTCDMNHQYKLIPGAPVTDYYKAYKDADVCLIPLVNSRFNRHKSNLKVLEAANLGLPVIASNVHPYKDLPIKYCNNSNDWVTNIKRFVESSKRRKEAGAELKEYCDRHFNFNEINKERKQIFEHYNKTVTV